MRPADRPRPETPRAHSRPAHRRRRPVFDLLEDRVVLSRAIIVNTLSDAASLPAGQVSLRAAITQADSLPGVTIGFKQGLTGTIALGSPLPDISSNMTILGPGASKIAVEGGGAGSDFSVLAVDSGVTASISGLTLTGGNATGNESAGGGLINSGTLTLTGLTIAGNTAIDGGGISNNPTGVLTLDNSTVSSNTAADSGGGINNDGTLTLVGSTISGNQATGVTTTYQGYTYLTGGNGGGIENYGSLTARAVTLAGNSAYSAGGGLNNGLGATASLSGSTITGNSASDGGGLFNFGAATLDHATVSDNSAAVGGGASNVAALTIDDGSTVSGNTATAFGGGILNQSLVFAGFPQAILTIQDSTISGNSAGGYPDSGGGAGIYSTGTLGVYGSNVSDNTAAGPGGGIRTGYSTSVDGQPVVGGQATIVGSTISDNSATKGGGVANVGNLTISDSTISANSASVTGGGGIYNGFYTSASIASKTISGNSATRGGGAVNYGTLGLSKSSISNNSALYGGGGQLRHAHRRRFHHLGQLGHVQGRHHQRPIRQLHRSIRRHGRRFVEHQPWLGDRHRQHHLGQHGRRR